MVLTEVVRMAEGNSSPINNVVTNNSVMTAAGITGKENTNTKLSSPTRLVQTKFQSSIERPMLSGGHDGSSSQSSRNKQPIYTRDKRTKFTQRENKKWVRLATVLGYLVAVCIPAIALSIYYIGFWDPNYKAQYEQQLRDKMMPPKERQATQQCCTSCACSGSSGATTAAPSAGRESRHLPVTQYADDPAKLAASHLIYDGNGDHAYYHNVLMGKNYVIYGAANDDTSAESGTILSSPPVTQPAGAGTQASEKVVITGTEIVGSPPVPAHEKRNHANSAASNYATPQHQQHRQHKAQPPQ